jgi:competence protein ComEC
VLTVLDGEEIVLLAHGWPLSPFSLLAVVRGWAQRVLAEALPAPQLALAEALLLGEDTALGREGWDVYQKTGVIHVLAISGQHLMVLGGFLWLFSRRLYLRRRWAAPLIALGLFSYALLTGAGAPVMRAAWMVLAWCGAILLQRPVQLANLFALGWLGVVLFNPVAVFNTGCQLSFVAVAVLIWGASRWQRRETDPLQLQIEESQPWFLRLLRRGISDIIWAYAINAAVWLAVTPLIAGRYHLVSLIALVLGPPIAFLSSIALLAGFGLLLVAPWGGPIAWPFALATHLCLGVGDLLVRTGAALPWAYTYTIDVPTWWLWVFYAGLLLVLTVPQMRTWISPLLVAGLAWLGLGLILQLWPHRPGEFRCTFLAVGHGGCTVIETPGGRVLLYDAGTIAGPEVTRRHIAPFLWQRGIHRLDEVILSHADLDHFNGVVALAERFTIRQVTSTPSFARRELAAVSHTLQELDRYGIPLRTIHAPDRWQVDGVSFTVLHPPAEGPTGIENVRSLVLLVEHEGLRLLLTGDLEGAGLTQVVQSPAPRVDVLMAPHHGSERSDPAQLAAWARPRCVVSCQEKPRSSQRTASHYEGRGADYLATWQHGAVTVRQRGEKAWIETYRSTFSRSLR